MQQRTTLTHVHGQFAKIRVELTGEAQASRDTRHDNGDKVVEIAIGRCRELQCPEANVVEGLIINAESFIRVLDKLVNRESRVVWLQTSTVKYRNNANI